MANKPAVVGRTVMCEGKFLRLELLDYVDARGMARKWEAAQRQKLQNAVFIIPVLRQSERVILIRQFRAPVNSFCLECPAGLIDDGEDSATAAVRELKEETGYAGTVVWTSEPTTSSAGLTGELISMAIMDIDETLPENQNPPQHLDEGEEIEVLLVRLDELGKFILDRQKTGDKVSSRLLAWAAGRGCFNQ